MDPHSLKDHQHHLEVCLHPDHCQKNKQNHFSFPDLSFAMHHELTGGPPATVPESTSVDSEDLQSRFHPAGSQTPPPPSQVISAGGVYSDHSWN